MEISKFGRMLETSLGGSTSLARELHPFSCMLDTKISNEISGRFRNLAVFTARCEQNEQRGTSTLLPCIIRTKTARAALRRAAAAATSPRTRNPSLASRVGSSALGRGTPNDERAGADSVPVFVAKHARNLTRGFYQFSA